MTKIVTLPVGDNFVAPDPRLYEDAGYVEEVLSTGVSVLRMKRKVEAEHVMDSRMRELGEEHEKTVKALSAEYEKKIKELLKTTEEKETDLSRWKLEFAKL
eukprot:56616-Eustigmatos_ZCMA.PRE.1